MHSKKDKSLWVIFFLLIINFISDGYGLYSLYLASPNYLTFNIYLLFETVCLSIFYYQVVAESIVKKAIALIISVFVVFWLYSFIRSGFDQFLYSCAAFENIFILVFALYYYYEQIIKINSAFIYMQPRFWIVSAYLVYIAGTFFLLLYIPSLNSKEQVKYYILNYVFVIIRTILLCIAMFMKDKSENQGLKLTQSSF